MNTFFYHRKPNTAFTKPQIKQIHQCLKNLGFEKTYEQFLLDLSDYCETQMEEDENFYLTSKEAAPFISNYVLTLLEDITQNELLSKIFALSSLQRQMGVDLQMPIIFVDETDVLEYIRECSPDLEEYLSIPETEHGLLVGFARPRPPLADAPEKATQQTEPFPKLKPVSRIKLGTAPMQLRNPNGTLGKVVTEIVKLSLFVGEYEIPLFRNTEQVNTVTVENIPCRGSILVQDEGLFTIPEYLQSTKEIATESKKTMKTQAAKKAHN